MSFAEALGRKEFLVVVETAPPKGTELTSFLEGALALKGRADAVLVSDCPQAVMRMSPLAPSRVLLEKGVEPILAVNGRDRNRLGFQAELLAAWAFGVRILLLEEGENPAYGDHPLAAACRDLNLMRMLEAAAAFRQGRDLSGEKLSGAADFLVGVSLKTAAQPEQVEQLAKTIKNLAEAGANFIVLSPAYARELLAPLGEAAAAAGLPCFASVLLLKSVGMARYLNDIPDLPKIPEDLITRLAEAPVKARAGLEIAAEFIRDLQRGFAGAVILPLGWEAKMPQLLELVGR